MFNYAKAIAAIIAAAASAGVAVLTDGTVTRPEWITIIIAIVTAASVFTAPNVPGARYTKTILAVLGGVLTLAVELIQDGSLNTSDWLQLLVAAAAALGVNRVSNSARPAPADLTLT